MALWVLPMTSIAQYQSKVPGGDFDAASIWKDGVVPVDTWKTIEIVANSLVTKNGNFSWANAVTVNGEMRSTGSFAAGYGGVSVNGKLTVDDQLSGNLTVGSNAVVTAKGMSGGSFDVKEGGLLTIENGDCTLTAAAAIAANGRVEIFGNLVLKSRLDMAHGSILIVHGNVNAAVNWGMSISGNMVVTGNFTASNAAINNDGNVVIGGNFTHSVGGFSGVNDSNFYLVGDGATSNLPGWSGSSGDKDDFLTNESNNNDLWDIVMEVMPEVVGNLKQWLGITPDWHTAANWKTGKVPDANTNVVINKPDTDKFMPVINGTATARSLSISNGAKLTLMGSSLEVMQNMNVAATASFVAEPGSKVSIHNHLDNKNGSSVLISNTPAKPTSFLVSKWVSNAVSVAWSGYPVAKYIAVGHSVDGNLYSNYGSSALIYKMVNNKWVKADNNALFNANPLTGYYIAFKDASPTVTHQGMLRQNDYSYTMGDTWEMIGNPYQTYIDVKSNAFNLNGANSTVYVAKQSLGKVVFATYGIGTGESVNGGSRYIAPGQSFYLFSNTSGTSFSIGSAARTHGDGAALKSAAVKSDVLRLELEGNETTDEQVMVFRAIGSDNYSSYYDSDKKFSTDDSEVALFTVKDNHKLVINALPADMDERTVPLYINVGKNSTGTMTLRATNMAQFMQGVKVFLIDRVAGKEIDLRRNPEYSFVATAGNLQQRFTLHFSDSVNPVPENATGIEGDASVSRVQIAAHTCGNEIVVKVTDASFDRNVHIETFDLSGRSMHRMVSQSETTQIATAGTAAIVVVKVTYRNATKVFKLHQSL